MALEFKIGLVSLSQLSFPGDKAARYQKSAAGLQALLDPMGVALYVYPQTVITPPDAKQAIAAMKGEQVDFLLVQCTSFSAGLLAQLMVQSNLPLGWWAIGEGAADGVAPLNSLCSINMYQAINRTYYPDEYHPAKWFFGEGNGALFAPRLQITLRALRALKAMRKSRVALIGGIAPGFNDLYFDERKLLHLFPGLEYDRLPEFDDILQRAESYTDAQMAPLAEAYEQEASGVHPASAKHHLLNARLFKAYQDFASDNHFNALAVSCWPKHQSQLDYSVCSVVGKLNDAGIPTACEGDALSAVSMLLMERLTQQSTMLMDLSAVDPQDDTLLLWHCGPAAKAFADVRGYSLGVNYHGKAHTPGQAPNCCGVTRDMVFGENTITIGRLAGECDTLLVSGGTFASPQKPSFFGSRGWLGSLQLNGQSLSALDYFNTVMAHGLSHHFPVAMGDVQNELLEICAWLRLKTVPAVPLKPYLQIY